MKNKNIWTSIIGVIIILMILFCMFFFGSKIVESNNLENCKKLSQKGYETKIVDTGFWEYGKVCKIKLEGKYININLIKEELLK